LIGLRYVYVLALVAWLGGIVTLGALVAPTTFALLQAADPSGGRALAGDLFGALIARFHYVQFAAGGLLLVTLMAMRILGPKPPAGGIRAAIIVVMLAIAAYSGFVVLTRIDAVQREIGALASTLAPTDPRRIEFDGLHTLSTRLMMLNLAGCLALVYWEAREK
jgi:hypothetical protein